MKFLRNNTTKKMQSAIGPRPEFVAASKARFLAAFDARHGTAPASTGFRFGLALRATVAVFIVVAGAFGMSVYADTKNVPADSPLYPFKRLNEKVVLSFASPEAKAQLEATFANRRASEIKDLEERNPSSTILSNLGEDFDADVSSSLSASEDVTLTDGRLASFCDNLLSISSNDSPVVQERVKDWHDEFEHYRGICATNIAAGTDLSASSTASSTGIPTTTTFGDLGKDRHRNGDGGRHGANSGDNLGHDAHLIKDILDVDNLVGVTSRTGTASGTPTVRIEDEDRLNSFLSNGTSTATTTTESAQSGSGSNASSTSGSNSGSGSSSASNSGSSSSSGSGSNSGSGKGGDGGSETNFENILPSSTISSTLNVNLGGI